MRLRDGNTAIAGTLSAGATTLSSTLGVTGDVNVNSGKFVVTAATGNTATLGSLGVGTTLAVTGAATLSGALTVALGTTLSNTLDVAEATTLAKTLAVTGDVNVGSGKFVVTASSGNTLIAGTLTAGATTLSARLASQGSPHWPRLMWAET